ncbi:MAG: hypothetical protein HUJ75_02320, partial [Parasporobacterium sp.]|nr:hypothetical protein [Parasporobacterium sp.]
ADFFEGSWVQTTVLILSLITVFMGSMLAFREPLLKKRLAYSTVSQVSYILFGVFVLNATAMHGAMLHVVSHALIKCTLFACAGAVIYITGYTRVDELKGIGRKMPLMLWCYTIVSLGLIGIPPFGGFASKWYLCLGALDSGIPVFGWLGPVVLLVSALLTAGYLLPISIKGFLPGNDEEDEADNGDLSDTYSEGEVSETSEDGFEDFDNSLLDELIAQNAEEPKPLMLVPIIIMTVLSVVIGLFPEVIPW